MAVFRPLPALLLCYEELVLLLCYEDGVLAAEDALAPSLEEGVIGRLPRRSRS